MNLRKIAFIVLLIIIIALIIVGLISLNESVSTNTTSQQSTTNVDENIENGAFQNGEEANNDQQQNNNVVNDGDVVVIEEKMFMNELNDVYLNYDDYDGKPIEYEGFVYNDEPTGAFVIGREYYCCGYDSYMVGFECVYPEGVENKSFEDDVWVKVAGTIRVNREQKGMETPYIEISTIEEKEQEGLRVVTY